MASTNRGRWSPRQTGLAAIIGALVGIVLTPFMASVWAYDDDEPWSAAPRLERAVGPTLESWGLLDFGGEDVSYEVYGKAFVLVYALMIPAVQMVHVVAVRDRASGRLEPWSWRVLFGALLAGGAGDFVAYWGASIPSLIGEAVSSIGFVVELFSMPVLVLASGVYGVVAFRIHSLPGWASVLLILVPASAITTTLLVTDYVPNAAVVPLSVNWAVVGVWLWISDGPRRNNDRSNLIEPA